MNHPQPDDPSARQDAEEQTKEPTVEIPTHEQEMTRLRDERDQLEQQLQRQLADAANMRRRHRQELDDSKQRALEALAQELLPVLDSFDLALATGGDAGDGPLREGVRMTRMLLANALARQGIEEIDALGQKFDPALHDAVSVEQAPGVPDGQVLRVLQSGYRLGGRVVRFARVVVAGTAKT